MNLSLVLLLLLSHSALADVNLPGLKRDCEKEVLSACEKLAAHHLEKSEWEEARKIAAPLCAKKHFTFCTLAGSSLLGQKKFTEAEKYLSKSCDGFEPYACRSLGRYYKGARQEGAASIYLKRACHFGLKEVCKEVKDSKQWYSPAALILMSSIQKDCQDTQAQNCMAHFDTVKKCQAPLTKQDCLMVAGHLSIYFRAKALQAEAMTRLFTVYTSELAFRADSKGKTYTYDFRRLMRETRPQQRNNYIYGFKKACVKKYVKAKRPQTNSLDLWPRTHAHLSARTKANILEYFKKGGEDCYPPTAGFEAYAVGSLDPLNPTRLDVWKIDQDKRMENVSDGLPLP